MIHATALKEWAQIQVSGPEAADWLNRICTHQVPVKSEHSEFFPAAILDYRGRARALFFVQQKKQDHFVLYLQPSEQEAVFALLQEAIFAEELEVSKCLDADGGAFLCLSDAPIETAQNTASPLATYSDWANLYFCPQLPFEAEVCELSFFTEQLRGLGLLSLAEMQERVLIESPIYLGYVSENKGCYPGQEVINKILSIGQVAKTLVVYEYDTKLDLTPGGGIKQGEQEWKVFSLGECLGRRYFSSFVRPKLVDSLPQTVNFQHGDAAFVATRRV